MRCCFFFSCSSVERLVQRPPRHIGQKQHSSVKQKDQQNTKIQAEPGQAGRWKFRGKEKPIEKRESL